MVNHGLSVLISYLNYISFDPSDLTAGSTFPDVNSMLEALQSGNISSVLLEMYVPVKRKDLFNNSWFVVKDLLEAEITHGVLLQGIGVSKLAKEMKNLIATNNTQTKYLTEGNDVVDQSKVRLKKNHSNSDKQLISSYKDLILQIGV